MKIKKNDNVLILKGKDRNKTGKIVRVLPSVGKVIVGGLNLFKRHIKPKRGGEKGKTVSVEFPVNVSNVALICSKCNKASRVGYKKMDSGEYERICKKCNQEI